MKSISLSTKLFALGFIVLLAANTVVLTGVAANRSDSPEALVALTERELRLPYRMQKENSGLSLKLIHRTLGTHPDDIYYGKGGKSAWFDAEKLQELGFSIDEDMDRNTRPKRYKMPVSKEVFIVLEYDGELHKEAVRRAELALEREKTKLSQQDTIKELPRSYKNAQNLLEHERVEASRLFAIDAGLDADKLRAKYTDRNRFIITPGKVNFRYSQSDDNETVASGYIKTLSVENIHVPLRFRQVFDDILAQSKPKSNEADPARYEIELTYGSRLEPWITAVRPMDK